ncbi:hypothetical protein NQ315_005649 [Exocentrus adspersus]|uniref:Zinc finger BED domain-containing protein 1-like n=1 Tax=Exocentrus adspersus TaxID=1586481 RepID=A0AAV8V6X7_9CUCU|nr:hypothetical protein NQ315_005649 [Exocentrus adspersus]
MKRKHLTIPIQRSVSRNLSSNDVASSSNANIGNNQLITDVDKEQTVNIDNFESTSTQKETTCSQPLVTSQVEHVKKKIPVTYKCKSTVQQDKSDRTIPDFMVRPLSLSQTKIIDRQLVTMIVKEYHPFRLVEDMEFKKLINILCPSYNLPSRKTISESLIPSLYDQTYEEIKLKIKEGLAVCLTTDAWTSINNDSFVAITVHYINNNWTLSSNLLGCVKYKESHTSDNLSKLLKDSAHEWGIENKITAITTDNASNIVKATKLCNWRHIPCFAHTINLIVQSGIDCLKNNILSKVKAIVEYFKRSSSALNRLHEMQEQMKLPNLKLKQDVPTRWNSTYEMLNRILKIKEAVVATLALVNRDLNTLGESDWLEIKQATDVLWVFNEVTVELCAEKSVSLSKILYFIKVMRKHLSADKFSPEKLSPYCHEWDEGSEWN